MSPKNAAALRQESTQNQTQPTSLLTLESESIQALSDSSLMLVNGAKEDMEAGTISNSAATSRAI